MKLEQPRAFHLNKIQHFHNYKIVKHHADCSKKQSSHNQTMVGGPGMRATCVETDFHRIMISNNINGVIYNSNKSRLVVLLSSCAVILIMSY